MKVSLIIVLLYTLKYVNNEPLSFARDPLFCYECDSDVDKHCGDHFNRTEPKFTRCNGRCVKLKYKRSNGFYYRRTCINNIRDIVHIRYTVDVCYSGDSEESSGDVGAFCLCEEHYCNAARGKALFSWKSVNIIMLFNFCAKYYDILVS